MDAKRQPKKSETIEVRLSFESKDAFMARCQAKGLTASQVIRAFIAGEIDQAPRARPHPWPVAIAAAAAGLAVGAVAAPSLANPVGHRAAGCGHIGAAQALGPTPATSVRRAMDERH